MKKTFSGFMVLLFLAACDYALAFEEYKQAYLAGLEKQNATVFIAQCGSETDPEYSAWLLFEAGKTEGKLAELKNGYAVNFADIKILPEGVRMMETNGGVYSYERVSNLALELSGISFNLLSPMTVEKYNALPRPKERCKFDK